MIASAQEYMLNAAWLIMAPGLCILLTVLTLQVVGDGLRDALDPRLRPADMSVPPRLLEVDDLQTFFHLARWMRSTSQSAQVRPWRSLGNPAAATR
jgi:hypothetical protein